MPFPVSVRLEALILCQRHYCCLCHQRKHTRIQCHHIAPEADGGPNTLDNCLPVCLDCHAEVMAYNPNHPIGTPYYPAELKRRRDDWYAVVRQRCHGLAANLHRTPVNYPGTPSIHGQVRFNYSNHDGFYRLGDGDNTFLTRWSKASNTSIHCYQHNTNLTLTLALAPRGAQLSDIREASLLNYTSRVRTPQTEQFVVFENHRGRYAAARIIKIEDDRRGDAEDRLTLAYWILEDGSDDFSVLQ